MFPYRDENETIRTPVVTLALIAANILVWLLVQGAGSAEALAASVCNYGLIPGELLQTARPGSGFPVGDGVACLVDPGSAPEHIFTSMFLHGDWLHLGSNMWFLWLFGNNVEDSMGRFRYIVFYLLCGIGAAFAQVFSSPTSIYPMVGASGAISGVMGAYVVLYPRVRVYCLVVIVVFVTTVALPAWAMIGYWALVQLAQGLVGAHGGVAIWAHIGGLVVGALIVKRFAQPEYVREHKQRHWRPRRYMLDR